MKRRPKPLNKNPQPAHIEALSHDGRGIARLDGKTTFISGALPGEEVLFQLTQSKSHFSEGRLLEVRLASAERITPRCPHYSQCGGCSLQHLDAERQLKHKQTVFFELLQKIGRVEPQKCLDPLFSDSWHYRNKARLSVRYLEKAQQISLGFRRKDDPRHIASIDVCPVLHEGVERQLPALRSLLQSLDAPQSIAQVEVAVGENKTALIFRNLETLSERDCVLLREFGDLTGFDLYLQPGGHETVARFYPDSDTEALYYSFPPENIQFQFHPTDFTQVNASVNRLMIERVIQLLALTPEDRVLDLFCGLGNFSLPLARKCQHVIGIEGSTTMVARAEANAKLNGITNADFYCVNLESEHALDGFKKQSIHKIVIDPPRCGALNIVKKIDCINPTHIVYVSCNPATLARDTDILVHEKGYTLAAAGVIDMFPQTAHVESLALFIKGKSQHGKSQG